MGLWQKVVLALSLTAVIFQASPAHAAVAIARLDLQATLREDGTVAVTDQIDLTGSSRLNWTVFSNVQHLTVTANGQTLPPSAISIANSGPKRTLTSRNITAKSWRITYVTTSSLIRHDNRDQFFFKVFQEPGMSIGVIKLTFTLPGSVDQKLLDGNVYAIGGVVNASQEVVSNQKIVYSADFAGPSSLMTINASWPKSLLHLSTAQEAKLALSNLDVIPWIVLGVALPLLTLLVLVVLVLHQRQTDKLIVMGQTSTPPANLSPLIVGVLVNKKIYPEEIVALLADLCQRGYLVIIKKKDDYFLGRRRLPDQYLQSWERSIIETLLPGRNLETTDKELFRINRQSLFSPEVRDAFAQIYQVITQQHYFAENPHITRIRYKLIALGLYFASVIGLIWTAITGATPYLMVPLVGTIILSWLILRLTIRLINYTSTGNEQRAKWLAFANYLSDPSPVNLDMSQSQAFERFLPYAIVLGRTEAWARRFDKASTIRISPDWFINYEEITTVQFAKELVAFTRKVSKVLASMRGPLVS